MAWIIERTGARGTTAHADGLSPRSIRKYHVFLSSIFGRAVKDRVLIYNPSPS